MPYAVAVRLEDEGLGDHTVAVALGVEDAQVPGLLEIAHGKLDVLMACETV